MVSDDHYHVVLDRSSKMSNFFARLKKGRGADKQQQAERQNEASVAAQKIDENIETASKSPTPSLPPVVLESPTHAVETDSIFKGLKLSAQVAHSERSDSPYLQKSQEGGEDDEETNGDSKFSFLHGPQSNDGGDSDKSEEEEESSSGFAFLNPSTGSEPEPRPPEEVVPEAKSEERVGSDVIDGESTSQPAPLQPALPLTPEKEVVTKSPFKSPGVRTAGRQLPPTAANKKKKKKAIRPGHQQTTTAQSDGEVPPIITNLDEEGRPKVVDDPEEKGPLVPICQREEEEGAIDQKEEAPSIKQSDAAAKDKSRDKSEDEQSQEQLIEIEDKEAIVDEVTMETKQPPVGIIKDSPKSSEAEGGVVTSSTEETTSQPATIETVNESDTLEEVFGNYRIELSGEERLGALLQSYQSGIRKMRDGEGSSGGEQNHAHIIERELSSVELLISQRSKVQRLKAEEAKALAEEDYESAERLSKELEQMALISEWNIADTGLKAIKDWMNQCAELSENERELRTSMQAQLTALKEEQSQSLQEINKQLASLRNKEKMKVEALQDKIERERGHLALDREHLERSEAKIREEVESRAATPINAKLRLEEKLSEVENEIASLEAKLSELRRERDNLREGITAEEATITAVKEELSVEQLQLDKEREQIEQRDSELKKEEEKLAKERHMMAATLEEEESKRDSVARVIEQAGVKCAEMAGVGETVEELLSQLQPLLDDCHGKMKPSEHITRLHNEFTSCALEVEKKSSEVLASQTKLSSLTKKVSDDEIQLQQLSDAKQAAVTGRQFKEAGRLAAESKALVAKLDEERSEVNGTRAQLDDLNGELSELSEKLTRQRQEMEEEEKNEDEGHIERLGAWIRELKEKGESVRGTALQEVLEKWCHLHQLLRESLSTKHGLTVSREDGSTSEDEVKKEVPTEERTPGVGSEEDRGKDAQEDDRDGSGEAEVVVDGEREKLCRRMSAIEAALDKACQNEDFDKAAELDEELQTVKKLLQEKS